MNEQTPQLTTTEPREAILRVNGIPSVVMVHPDETLTIVPVDNTPESLRLRSKDSLQNSKQTNIDYDPIKTLLMGAALVAGSFLLVMLFMPREKLPYEETICKPQYFFFVQVGETCRTERGYR